MLCSDVSLFISVSECWYTVSACKSVLFCCNHIVPSIMDLDDFFVGVGITETLTNTIAMSS